jgi:spore germination protein
MLKGGHDMPVHVVKSGENLWVISNFYSVSLTTLVEVNGLQSANAVVPGLSLYIPDSLLPSRYYQIQSGDNLWDLSLRFQTSLTNILLANPGVDPDRLYIGQRLTIPSPLRMEIASLGFIIPFSPETFLASFNALARQITYLAVVAYSLTDEGYAYVELNDSAIVSKSRQLNVIPLLMIRNFKNGEFSPELIGKVLENPTLRNNLVESLVQLTRERGYGGVSIDFEFIPPQRRFDFIKFLKDLKTELGELILHVNVHAKSQDLPTNRIVGAYDYRAIGNVADIVAVMTIDYGYPTGPPDPIAPIWWMEEVIRYALSNIISGKLQIAFALYGYDKVVSTHNTKALSVQGSQNQAISNGAFIEYDSYAQAPWYRYWKGTEEHIVWFEDIRSYMEKYRLLDLYQLSGATFWQLSLAAPQNWAYMNNKISVLKGI